MKTITEFSAFDLRRGYALKGEILKSVREEAEKQAQAEKTTAPPVSENAAEQSTEETKVVEATEQTQSSETQESTEPKVEVSSTEENSEQKSEDTPQVQEAAVVEATGLAEEEVKTEALVVAEETQTETATPASDGKLQFIPSKEAHPGSKKKGKKNHRNQKQGQKPGAPRKSKEEIIAEKKAMEEKIRPLLETKITEEFKLEGERLGYFINSLSVIFGKRIADLRRVVVFTVEDEKEKVSEHARKVGDHFFLAEYMAPLVDKSKRRGKGKFGKGGRGKGRGKGKGGRFDKKKGGGGGRDFRSNKGPAKPHTIPKPKETTPANT